MDKIQVMVGDKDEIMASQFVTPDKVINFEVSNQHQFGK
jgi:hypothetical protein